MTTPRVTVPVEPTSVSPVYNAAYDSIRKGAPGLSDATCAVIARSINMKVSCLSAAPAGGAVRGPGGYLVKDFADGWYWTPNAALDHASGAPVWSVADGRYETDPPALATREEAPADPCASHKAEGIALDPCCPTCEAPAEAAEAINWKSEYEAVCASRISDRQQSQEIINERDKWIVELTRERDAAQAILQDAISEAVPDAMIFAGHPDAPRYTKALEGLRSWTDRARTFLNKEADQ